MKTLLLDTATWDLVLDASGGIAVAADPYSVAQDVASACRVFQGEQWYNTAAGVPYFQRILGVATSLSFIKAKIAAAAATVPGCNNPTVYITGLKSRTLTGQVQFTDDNGNVVAAALREAAPFILGESNLGGSSVI